MVIPEVPLSQLTNLAVATEEGHVCLHICIYAYRHIYTYMCLDMYA